MMFCGRCGTQNSDDTSFCQKCGAPLNGTSFSSSGTESVQLKEISSKNNRKIGIIAVAIVAVVIVVILVSLFGGRSYKATVNKYVQASYSADGKAMVSLIPSKVIQIQCEDADMTKSEFIEQMTESLEYALSYSIENYYDDWSFSYEIIEVEDYSHRMLKSLQQTYEDEYDVNVKAAKLVTIEVTITADEDNEFSNSMQVSVIKVGRSWYIDVR